MFPNGSGGAGRFLHGVGRRRSSREAVKISSRSVNRRTRRAGNGISLAVPRGNRKRFAVTFEQRTRRVAVRGV